jgi:hypothetical protein
VQEREGLACARLDFAWKWEACVREHDLNGCGLGEASVLENATLLQESGRCRLSQQQGGLVLGFRGEGAPRRRIKQVNMAIICRCCGSRNISNIVSENDAHRSRSRSMRRPMSVFHPRPEIDSNNRAFTNDYNTPPGRLTPCPPIVLILAAELMGPPPPPPPPPRPGGLSPIPAPTPSPALPPTFLSMNMGFLPSRSRSLKRANGFSSIPTERSWSPWTM